MSRIAILLSACVLISTCAFASDSAKQTLLSEGCTECHNSERIDKMKLDREGWEEIVQQMQEKAGGTISDKAAAAITDFLTETHGSK